MAVSDVMMSLALMLLGGFFMTRLTKLAKLPNVTAYILTGILLGPYVLNLVPKQFVKAAEFLPDLALAFIAFSVGEFFRFSTLKKNGWKVIVITLFEALTASLVIFVAFYFVMGVDLPFSVMLAALASATAPASTLMTIRQFKAKGDLVDTLLQVVALDDVVGLIAYSVAISIAMSSISFTSGNGSKGLLMTIGLPIAQNLLALLLGCLFGLALYLLMKHKHSTDNRLIIALAVLIAFCALCSFLNVSPLLGCMAIGMIYINTSDDERLFKQLNYFSPPILLLFFVRSGMSFDLSALGAKDTIGPYSLLVIAIVYFVLRIVGKYVGAWLGCLVTHKPAATRRYLGLGLVPQAGVAIGLAAMCARLLGEGMGTNLQTIILCSSVLYELIGPVCGKLSLYLSGSYGKDNDEDAPASSTGEPLSAVDALIERIKRIQIEMENEKKPTPEESAFDEAVDEQEAAVDGRPGARNRLFR